ncbi:MAG: hypothetical protein GY795_40425 [Desulfobacterales bacterium]|nr:hypothetical protein [Desulfobacterales bacterium]
MVLLSHTPMTMMSRAGWKRYTKTPAEDYGYDPKNGIRISETNTERSISGKGYSYSDEDHLLTAGNATYRHDADGFLEKKTDASGDTLYDYSSRGELLSVTLPEGTFIEYVHDPYGRRIAKKKDGAVVEKYLWKDRIRLLAVYDGNDSFVMGFEYADGRMPVTMTADDSSVYYLTYDQVGSLRIVTDASGTVVRKTDYDSFGNIYSDSNPAFEVPFGFAGGLHDRDARLVRFGYRDYDPEAGRWTAKDPIGFAGGDSDLFGYCLSDPVNFVDPEGLIIFAIGAILISSAGYSMKLFLLDIVITGVAISLYMCNKDNHVEKVEKKPCLSGTFKDPKLWTREEIRDLAKRVDSGEAEDHEIDSF